MGKLCAVISCLLLSVGAVTAQGAQTSDRRLLPQWLTGIIAVASFLFLTFVGHLVKKAWCETPSREKTMMELMGENENVDENVYETSLETVREKTTTELVEENEYVNENLYETSLETVREKTTTELVVENEYVNENLYESSLEMVRSKEDANAYNNLVIDDTADKVTAM